jgi:hypothetical protein
MGRSQMSRSYFSVATFLLRKLNNTSTATAATTATTAAAAVAATTVSITIGCCYCVILHLLARPQYLDRHPPRAHARLEIGRLEIGTAVHTLSAAHTLSTIAHLRASPVAITD